MRLLTGYKRLVIIVTSLLTMATHVNAQHVFEENPDQIFLINSAQSTINDTIAAQTRVMQKIGALQWGMAGMWTKMELWQVKFNGYLKEARGYAEALKAGTSLYADGVETMRHLYEIQRAIEAHPIGIAASIPMNNLYVETAVQFAKVYRMLKVSVAGGKKENMLTGAERAEMLWMLSDEMAELNRNLRQLAISIAYYNLNDVWNMATAGMVDKSHADIAREALSRWERTRDVITILNPK